MLKPTAYVACADNIDLLRELDADSFEAVVTDPPYGLDFMCKKWDSFARVSDYAPQSDAGYGNKGILPSYGRGGSSADREAYHRRSNANLQSFTLAWAAEVRRVLKPGGYLLAFGGTRTFHRLACGIEDAGFEIRDAIRSNGWAASNIGWHYGSGFPKSIRLNANSTFCQCGEAARRDASAGEGAPGFPCCQVCGKANADGYGTALKPSYEPIVVARKPLVGTVAENVLRYGTGALNIDGCRVGFSGDADRAGAKPQGRATSKDKHVGAEPDAGNNEARVEFTPTQNAAGRWPPNTLLTHSPACVRVGERRVESDGHFPASRPNSSVGGTQFGGYVGQDGLAERSTRGEVVAEYACVEGCPVAELDQQSGTSTSGDPRRRDGTRATAGAGWGMGEQAKRGAIGDFGGASRFFPVFDHGEDDALEIERVAPFHYCAKAARSEREEGCEHLPARSGAEAVDREGGTDGLKSPRAGAGRTAASVRNHHPTVKPVKLMRWLVRLVTPPGGTVLDPFAGSGTTGVACVREGIDFVGIEREAEYVAIAEARIAHAQRTPEKA